MWAGSEQKQSQQSKAQSSGQSREVKSGDGMGKLIEGQVEILKSVLDMPS